MRGKNSTQQAKEIIARMRGEFLTRDLHAQGSEISAPIFNQALLEMRRRGVVEKVGQLNGKEGIYRFIGQREQPARLSPLEQAWRELRASMGDLSVPDFNSTSMEARNS